MARKTATPANKSPAVKRKTKKPVRPKRVATPGRSSKTSSRTKTSRTKSSGTKTVTRKAATSGTTGSRSSRRSSDQTRSPRTETNAKTGSSSSPRSETNAKTGSSSSPRSETNAKAGSGSSPRSETNAKTGSSSSPRSETNAKAGSGSSPRSETNAKTGSGSSPRTETNAKTGSRSSAETRDKTGSSPSPRTETSDKTGSHQPGSRSSKASSGETGPRQAESKSRTTSDKPGSRPAEARKAGQAPVRAKTSHATPSEPTEVSPEAQAAIEEGFDALEDRDFELAAERLLVAASLVPGNWRLPNEAAICYYHLQQYDDAVRCCDLALAAAPTELQVIANKGLMLTLASRDDEALATFQSALEVDPTYPTAFLEIGKLLQKRGDYEDALEYFTTALAHETMRGAFDVSGQTQVNPHLLALVHVNKARILLGPLDRETEGLEHVAALWTAVKDVERMLLVARELAKHKPRRAQRVLDLLLAVKPEHDGALALRAQLADA